MLLTYLCHFYEGTHGLGLEDSKKQPAGFMRTFQLLLHLVAQASCANQMNSSHTVLVFPSENYLHNVIPALLQRAT